jgi:hypothetical protein
MKIERSGHAQGRKPRSMERRLSPNGDLHRRDLQRQVYVDSGRSESKIFYAETFVKGGWTVVPGFRREAQRV